MSVRIVPPDREHRVAGTNQCNPVTIQRTSRAVMGNFEDRHRVLAHCCQTVKPVCFDISRKQNALMTTYQLSDDGLIIEERPTGTLDGSPGTFSPDRIEYREPTGIPPNKLFPAHCDMVLHISLYHGLAQFLEER